MGPDERFFESIRLFNERKFFQSHEVLETLWLEVDRNDFYRDLYKGLIQAAATFLHLLNNNFSGAKGLFRSSIKYLNGYSPYSLGLDIDRLVKEMSVCRRVMEDNLRETDFKFDSSLIPIARLVQPREKIG